MAQKISDGQLVEFFIKLKESGVSEFTLQAMIDYQGKFVLWAMLRELAELAQEFNKEVQDGVGAVHLRCALSVVFEQDRKFLLRQAGDLIISSAFRDDPEKWLSAALVYAETTNSKWDRSQATNAAEAHHKIADRVFALSQVAEAFLDQDAARTAREYAGGVAKEAGDFYKVKRALRRLRLLEPQFGEYTTDQFEAWKQQEIELVSAEDDGGYEAFETLLSVAEFSGNPEDEEALRTHLGLMNFSRDQEWQKKSFLARIAEITKAPEDVIAARALLFHEGGKPALDLKSWMRVASVTRTPMDFHAGFGNFIGMRDLRWLKDSHSLINRDEKIADFSRFLVLLAKTVQKEFVLELK